jgi:hypothetical protein
MKMFLFLTGFVGSVLFGISGTSHAAPFGGGFRAGGFHGNRLIARNARPAFMMGGGARRDLRFHQGRFFHRRDHRFFAQQVFWPVYWYPYYDSGYYPWDTSYLDYGSDNDYGYASDSAALVQPQNPSRAASTGPLVVVVNQGNSPSADSSKSGYAVNNNSGPNVAESTQRTDTQRSNEQAGTRNDPLKSVSPPVTQAPQVAVQAPQMVSQPQANGSSKFVLVSWLNDGGKDEIYVQNAETKEVQKITSKPNRENFRIVELHPNADPKEFEAIISNGNEQMPVRFRF